MKTFIDIYKKRHDNKDLHVVFFQVNAVYHCHIFEDCHLKETKSHGHKELEAATAEFAGQGFTYCHGTWVAHKWDSDESKLINSNILEAIRIYLIISQDKNASTKEHFYVTYTFLEERRYMLYLIGQPSVMYLHTIPEHEVIYDAEGMRFSQLAYGFSVANYLQKQGWPIWERPKTEG